MLTRTRCPGSCSLSRSTHTLCLRPSRDNNSIVDLRFSAWARSIGSFKHGHGQRASSVHARDVSGSLMLGRDSELPVDALDMEICRSASRLEAKYGTSSSNNGAQPPAHSHPCADSLPTERYLSLKKSDLYACTKMVSNNSAHSQCPSAAKSA